MGKVLVPEIVQDKIRLNHRWQVRSGIVQHRWQVVVDGDYFQPDDIGPMLPDPGNLAFAAAILLKNQNVLHSISPAAGSLSSHQARQISSRTQRVQKR